MLKQIDTRLYNEFTSYAHLHGVKMPKRPDSKEEVSSLTAEEEELMMRSLRQTQLRKLKRG